MNALEMLRGVSSSLGSGDHNMHSSFSPLERVSYLLAAKRMKQWKNVLMLGPVDPSFGALSRRLKLTVQRHKFNQDSIFLRLRKHSQNDRNFKLCETINGSMVSHEKLSAFRSMVS